MLQQIRRSVASSHLAALAVIAFCLIALSPTAAGRTTLAAYQSPNATLAAISNAPDFPYGSCVPVRVSISSDAGTPEGTVRFSVDGVVVDVRPLPSNGAFTEMIGCCRSRISTPLSVGTHHFAVDFIPGGNWAPSHASGQVVIHPTNTGSHSTPVCGGTVTSGFPTSVDAGLSSTSSTVGSHHAHTIPVAVSGVALALALGVIATFRRRRAGLSAGD